MMQALICQGRGGGGSGDGLTGCRGALSFGVSGAQIKYDDDTEEDVILAAERAIMSVAGLPRASWEDVMGTAEALLVEAQALRAKGKERDAEGEARLCPPHPPPPLLSP